MIGEMGCTLPSGAWVCEVHVKRRKTWHGSAARGDQVAGNHRPKRNIKPSK
jgi:hypothetical protein